MGWGFRRSVKIAPGIRLNLGKKSASVRVGGRGFGVTKSTTGRTTVSGGIPGTGLFYRKAVRGASSPERHATGQAFGSDGGAMAPEAPAAVPIAPPRDTSSRRPKPATWQWVVLGIAVVVMILGMAGQASIALGLGGVALGIWSVVQSRASKWPLVAAGLALLVGGIAQGTAQAEPRQPAPLVPSPAATVTTTVTATPSPTPTPTPTPTTTPPPAPTVEPTPTSTSAAAAAPLAAPAPTMAATSGSGSTGSTGGTTSGSKSTAGASGSGSAGTSGTVSYANCAAVRAAGKAPLYKGQPGYNTKLDRDGDGVACEK